MAEPDVHNLLARIVIEPGKMETDCRIVTVIAGGTQVSRGEIGRWVVGAGQAGILRPHDIDVSAAASQLSNNVVVQVLVGEKPKHRASG